MQGTNLFTGCTMKEKTKNFILVYMECWCDGLTNQEVAKRLGLTERQMKGKKCRLKRTYGIVFPRVKNARWVQSKKLFIDTWKKYSRRKGTIDAVSEELGLTRECVKVRSSQYRREGIPLAKP